MMEIIKDLPNHPAEMLSVIILVVIVAYFLMKKLLKLALIIVLILLGVSGYYYYKGHDKSAAGVMQAIEKTKNQTKNIVDKGKNIYEKSKDLAEEGKKISAGMNKIVDSNKDDLKTPSESKNRDKASKTE
jgi:uncharacterized protein HemX